MELKFEILNIRSRFCHQVAPSIFSILKQDFYRLIFALQIRSHSLTKGQLILKQNCRVITSPKKQTELIILIIFSCQDSELRLFFGRSYDSTILFRN